MAPEYCVICGGCRDRRQNTSVVTSRTRTSRASRPIVSQPLELDTPRRGFGVAGIAVSVTVSVVVFPEATVVFV